MATGRSMLIFAFACSGPPGGTGSTGTTGETGAVGTVDCQSLDNYVPGAAYRPDDGTCEIDAAIDPACVSDYMAWWSGGICPAFADYVVGLSADKGMGCGTTWTNSLPTQFIVQRCVSSIDGAPIDRVFVETCETDVCNGTEAFFDATAQMLSLRAYVTGSVPPPCCDSTIAWGGRSWGSSTEVDCSAAQPYSPEDFLSCGGSGTP